MSDTSAGQTGILQAYLADLESADTRDRLDDECIKYVRATLEKKPVDIPHSIKTIIEGDLKRKYNVDYVIDPAAVKIRPQKQFDPSDGIEIPIYADVVMSITPGVRKYTTALVRRGKALFRMDSKTKPWLSTKIQSDFISQAHSRLEPDERLEKQTFKKKIAGAFTIIREKIENDPNAKRALTAPAVMRTIDATLSVDAYPSENTFYLVSITEGGVKKEIQFSAGEISEMGIKPSTLNRKWLNAFPRGPLDATPDDAREIRDAWLDIVEIHEEETLTEIDNIVEKLRVKCEGVRAFKDGETITEVDKDAYYDEREGIVYVPSVIITALLKELGKEQFMAKLSGEMRHLGYMARGTMKKRIVPGVQPIRVWPIYAAFAKFKISDRERPKDVVDDVD